jgi:hypothetical protein
VSGVTEPGADLRVNGIAVGAISGGAFDEFFIVGPQGAPAVEVRAQSINGGVTVVTRASPVAR